MIEITSKNERRRARQQRARKRLKGTAARPRLNVYRSLNHIYAQLVDDDSRRVILAVSSRTKALGLAAGGNIVAAKAVGKACAEAARANNISAVVFDRGGYLYHGRVKALAEAAREAGLQF